MNRYDELKKHIEENAKLAYDLNYAVAADPPAVNTGLVPVM